MAAVPTASGLAARTRILLIEDERGLTEALTWTFQREGYEVSVARDGHEGLRRAQTKLWADKGYEPQMRRFVEAIREGRLPDVTVLDGVRSTIGCLKMMESARSGEPLELDLKAYRRGLESKTSSA